jgi:phage shock protein PspC (stress-responsive transcriptional regulator)
VNEPTRSGASAGSPPPPPPRPSLHRPREGRLIAGVAAGVAEHVGMDVAIVRILFVVVTIFTSGLGIAAYALAWIFVPEAETDAPSAVRARSRREVGGRDPLFWVGIGLLVVGAVWLLDRPGFSPVMPWFRLDGGVLVPLVLIAFGIALWRVSDDRNRVGQPGTTRTPAPPGSTPASTAPPVWQPADGSTAYRSAQETDVNDDPRPLDPHPNDPHPHDPGPHDPEADRDTVVLSRSTEPTAPPAGFSPPPGSAPPPGATTPPTAQGPAWSPPPVPRRERALLMRSTLGLALVTAGVLWLLRVADVLTVGTGQILAAALLVIGLGLLLGTFVGRGRGLIWTGLVLLPIVVVAEVVAPMDLELGEFRQGVGEMIVTPASLDDLEPSYQLGAGTLNLDLSGLEFTDIHRVAVQVGFGEIIVAIPDDVSVEITGQVAGGEFDALGRTSSGLALDRAVVDEIDDSDGLLVLDVQVGFGDATVRRVPTATISDR